MVSSDNLFLLIKSLSKAEKRFFTIEASKYSKEDGNDYLLLYKLIDQQTVYNEEKIKAELKGNPLLKRLPNAKNYLHNLLLRVLVLLDDERNPHLHISNLLQEVDFLFFRGLYKSAGKQLQKAKKIALSTQKFNFLLLISEWEVALANFEPIYDKSQKKILELQQERLQYLKEINTFSNIESLYEEIVQVTYKLGKARTPEEKQVYLDFFKRKEVLDAEQSSTLDSQALLYALKSAASHMIGDSPEDVFEFSKNRAELIQNASPELQLEHAYFRASAIFDYIQALLGKQEKEKAVKMLEDLKAYWTENESKMANSTNAMYFFVITYHSTKIPMLEGDFEKVANLARTLKSEFEIRQGQVDQNNALYIIPLNLGFCCFIRREYDEALFWFRYILNDTTITVRPDVLGFVRILHLLVQYELHNKHILSYYADSTKRFLEKNNKLFQFEQLFLNFIKQLAFKTTWDSEFKGILEKQKKKLQKLENTNSFEKQYIQQYHLVEWIESKLQQRTFEELILEKLRAREL